jgi:hypothetical protein
VRIAITCPKCSGKFTVDHLAAQREIDRLTWDNAALRAKVAALETMRRGDGTELGDLENLVRKMGMGS